MPVPPAVVAQAQVLFKTADVFWTRSMLAILRDGVGRILDGGESVRVFVHKGKDALRTLRFDLRGDIDQDECAAEICRP